MSHTRKPRRDGGRPRRRLAVAVFAVILAAAAVLFVLTRGNGRPRPWSSADEPKEPWNIVLVSLDTTRPDYLASFGGAVPSPQLDRVAGGGFVFRQMITPVPVTLPAHASLFTGQNPYTHGVHENVEYALPAGPRTIADAFRAAGYNTAAFIGAFVLNQRFGLARGFESYQDELWGPEAGLGPQTVELRGELVAARANAWIRDFAERRKAGTESRPFFLFVHFFDAHSPYAPPPPYDRTHAGRPYDGELAYQDACLGEILDTLEEQGEARRTLVWIISDHGEGLGDHGESQHSIFLYDPTLRVVSILRPPPRDGRYRTGPPRLQIEATTSLISVGPTLLDLAGARQSLPEAEGPSLRPILSGGRPDDAPVYCETLSPLITYHWAPLFGVRNSDWKYVRAPKRELYDLRADPRERINLIGRRPEEAKRLDDALSAFLARTSAGTPARRQPSAEERERLRSLGYLAGGGSEGDPTEGLPDPKDMMSDFDARYREITIKMSQRRFDEAVRLLRDALRADPSNNSLLYNLATALRGAGQAEEAGRLYRAALQIQPQSPRCWHGWGQAFLQAGQADSAAWAFGRGIELMPTSPDSWSGRGGARWLAGDAVGAAADFDTALARGGNPIQLHGLLARLYRDELHDTAAYQRHLELFARLRRVTPEQAAQNLPAVR